MTPATPIDALELLDADHRKIEDLLARYRELALNEAPPAQRKALAEEACLELTIHLRLEQELFDPALREALPDDEVVEEAEADHDSLRELVARILAMRAEDALYDARMALLAQYVTRHVQRERGPLFERVRGSGMDVAGLGRKLAVRLDELHAVTDALREEALASVTA
jgi:hypothetical protein